MKRANVRNLAIAGILAALSLWILISRFRSPSGTLVSHANYPKCHSLPNADQTLVVLKTGAAEFIHKFPVHVWTTLTCYPNYLVFSDHREVFQGIQIRDVLATVSPEIREKHEDFKLYRRLREGGRSVLGQEELSTNGVGTEEKPGWKLDKWKFLPMLNETYHLTPDKKWYIFLEADTSLLWSTLLLFTQQLSHKEPYYMGSLNFISDLKFAHGGSGFLVSNTALKNVVSHYAAHKTELEAFTANHWAGDGVAGKAFEESGTHVMPVWPIIQGDHPGIFPWGELGPKDEPRWCYPTATWHHIPPDGIEELWNFEQKWLSTHNASTPLLFRDVFTDFILPRIRSLKPHWDNKSSDKKDGVKDLEGCIEACEKDVKCLQYSFNREEGVCSTSNVPGLGEKVVGKKMRSGWMYGRIEEWVAARPGCGEELWITEGEE